MRHISVLTHISAIAMGTAFLWHFSNIWRFGRHYIAEPSLAILITECCLVLVMLSLALLSFVQDMREWRRDKWLSMKKHGAYRVS